MGDASLLGGRLLWNWSQQNTWITGKSCLVGKFLLVFGNEYTWARTWAYFETVLEVISILNYNIVRHLG